MATGISTRLSPAEGRRFGLLVGGVFLVIAGISYWRGHDTAPIVLAAIGGSLVIAGILIPQHLDPVYRGWMKIGLTLSKVTTPIIMGVIYFGLFASIGALRRAFGRNALLRAEGDTFWVTREPGTGRRSDLHRQF